MPKKTISAADELPLFPIDRVGRYQLRNGMRASFVEQGRSGDWYAPYHPRGWSENGRHHTGASLDVVGRSDDDAAWRDQLMEKLIGVEPPSLVECMARARAAYEAQEGSKFWDSFLRGYVSAYNRVHPGTSSAIGVGKQPPVKPPSPADQKRIKKLAENILGMVEHPLAVIDPFGRIKEHAQEILKAL